VVGFDVKQDRWEHADNFLSRDQTRVRHLHHQLVDALQADVLLEKLTRDHHLEQDIVRVERLAVHLQLCKVHICLFDAPFYHLCLIHIDSSTACSSFLCLFWLLSGCGTGVSLLSRASFPLDKLFDKIRVLEHLTDATKAGFSRVQAERHGELVVQRLQEHSKFLLCGQHLGENFFVVFIEAVRANRVVRDFVWLNFSAIAINLLLSLPLFIAFLGPVETAAIAESLLMLSLLASLIALLLPNIALASTAPSTLLICFNHFVLNVVVLSDSF